MAIARLSIKIGVKGKAANHAAYVAREGHYANRLEKGEVLEAKDSGNMPSWAQDNPQMFWVAADAYERKNGTSYREMEIALPRELESGQREALVRDWVQQEIGNKHPYQLAIHSPTAADGGEQPHVHLMFSERRCDGIERDPDQYFKRYNGKEPEKGGARKGYGEKTGARTLEERRQELIALRKRWQERCNAHLEHANQAARIDMRSYQAQGVNLEPEKKMLPSEWRDAQIRGQVIDYRAAKEELTAARREVESVLRQEAQKQAIGNVQKAQQQKVMEDNRARIAKMSARDIREINADLNGHIISNNRHQGYALKMAITESDRHPAVIATRGYCKTTKEQADRAREQVNEAKERERQAQELANQYQIQLARSQQAADAWASEHSVRHWMHSKGIKRDASYTALERRVRDEQQASADAQKQLQAMQQSTAAAERAAEKPVREEAEAIRHASQVRSDMVKQEMANLEKSPVFQQFKSDIQERYQLLEQRERERDAQQERDYERLANEQKHRRENAPQRENKRNYNYGPKM